MTTGRLHRHLRAIAIGVLLITAAWLRLQGVDWDQGQHLHPDERFLTMVANDVRLPHTLGEYFDTSASRLNPVNAGHGFFVYGTFPLFATRVVAQAIGLADYGHLHLVGRVLAGLFDLGTVVLTYRVALLLAGPAVGLGAMALMVFSVASIQQAHFFTVDSFGVFFTTGSILMLVKIALTDRLSAHALFGISLGLMLACRVNLLLLAALYPLAVFCAWRAGLTERRRSLIYAVAAGAAAAVTFRVFQPYAFAGPGFFDVTLAREFLQSISAIRGYVTGAVDYPPSVQWIGRLPIVFPGKNLFLWGLGPAWGVAAIAGVIWGLRPRQASNARGTAGIVRVALLWAPLLFFYQATQFAATVRYFLPIVPIAALAAAWLLLDASSRRRTATAVFALVLTCTALWALAFTAIYRRPHTRVEASRWLYGNVEPDATLATEHWDDALPLRLPGHTPDVFQHAELRLYDEENEQKRGDLLAALDSSELIVLSSNRLYASIPRTPWRYPLGRRYYELLFAGDLGFSLQREFTSYPRLGPFEINDDGAEEAFTVYDHPKVLVFRKTKDYSRARVAALLQAVPLTGIVRVTPREASSLYRRMQPADVHLAHDAVVRTSVPAFRGGSWGALFRWLGAFELLSLAWFALLFRTFAAVRDHGYGFAKILAWAGSGTVVWWLASTGLATYSGATAQVVAGSTVLAGGWAAWRRKDEIQLFLEDRSNARTIAAVEAVFLAAFLLFALIRAMNPSIFWGEKPMDFAILNAVLRSPTMPPADPWFAGEPLNYFYFGHALTAAFARISGVPAAFAFNLGIATLAGLLATAAFLVAFQLISRIGPAMLAAAAATLMGNLAGPRLIFSGTPHVGGFDYFWSTSRVIAGTINEYPFWTLAFADLHAHALAMPFEVGLLYLGVLWVARSTDGQNNGARSIPSPALVLAIGWLLGMVAVTSSWSAPASAALQLGFLVTAWRQNDSRLGGLARVAVTWIAIVLTAWGMFWPFWSHFRGPASSWGRLTSEAAPLADVVTIFGIFFVASLPALVQAISQPARWRTVAVVGGPALALALVAGWWRSPACGLFFAIAYASVYAWFRAPSHAVRAGALLVAAAATIGGIVECVFVWDRMNTVFKFYLQMWLMLSLASATLAWAALRQASGFRRSALAAALAAAVSGGLFTSASGLVGHLREPRARSPLPTLNGLAYLETEGPAELTAFEWLNREVAGIPVVLEAHGPSYQAFSRVSMNTGLPTVVGWEYHLVQQNHNRSDIDGRAADVQEIYETTDATRAGQLLRKYHVDLIFVGPLERQTYASTGLAKFADPSFVQPLFSRNGVAIYASPGRTTIAKAWIEPVRTHSAPRTLREPRAIATAPDGSFFVADFGHKRIQHVDRGLRVVDGFGNEGVGPAEFKDPCGIAVAADGTVWVADTWNHRVQKLTPGGSQVAEWHAGFYGPRGIAVSADGAVYVTDTGNHRVVRFDRDGTSKVLVDRGLLDNPVGIALDREELFVADVGHRRILVLSTDGTFLREWPVDGWSSSALREPYVAIGPDGVVWVTDPSGRRVLLFDRAGVLLGTGVPTAPLEMPLGIAVTDRDAAVVTDAGTGRVVEVRRQAADR